MDYKIDISIDKSQAQEKESYNLRYPKFGRIGGDNSSVLANRGGRSMPEIAYTKWYESNEEKG